MYKFILITFCLLLTGCPKPNIPTVSKPTTQFSNELGKKHLEKENTIVGATNNIDEANKADSNNVIITENVAVIREEVKKAPTQELLDAANADNKNKDAVIKTLEEQITKLKEYVKKLEDSITSKQVWFFNIAGGVCLALASLAAYLGQPKYGITLTVLGLFCLGVAQIVGLVWFKYAVFGLGVVGFIALVAAIIYNYNKHEAHKAVDEEATDYYDVLIKLIPVFDKAYETATPEMQKWLEETILVKLGRAYNDKDKALIHTIRADVIKLRGKTGS